MNGFTIYREYYDLITLLSEKEQQELLLAIVKYMFEDTIPTLNDKQMKIFRNLKRPLDISKNNSKRSIGNGAPIGNQNALKKQTEKQTKKQTKNKPKELEKTNTSKMSMSMSIVNGNVYGNDNNLDIYSIIEDNFGRILAPLEYQEIQSWLEDVSAELVIYATKIAVCNNAYSVKYISRILERWKREKITTLGQAKKSEENFKNKNGNGNVPEWFDKEIKKLDTTREEQEALNKALSEYK